MPIDCIYPERSSCRECEHSMNPAMFDGGCKLYYCPDEAPAPKRLAPVAFRDWLYGRYKWGQEPLGMKPEDLVYSNENLCYDLQHDRRYPRYSKETYDGILEYLQDRGASHGCIDAFKRCWNEYLSSPEYIASKV